MHLLSFLVFFQWFVYRGLSIAHELRGKSFYDPFTNSDREK